MEWLLLLVLIPAVVVPVVLLWGFAGCDVVFGLELPPSTPTDVTAAGSSISTIKVAWQSTDPGSLTFEVVRNKDNEGDTLAGTTTETEFEDIDLEQGPVYAYKVRATLAGRESAYSPYVQATTKPFGIAFSTALANNANNLEGNCIVQRIEPIRLNASGSQVRITIHSGPDGMLKLDRIYISQADPQGDQPYDSAADLTLVATNVVVPPNSQFQLPTITYAFDRLQPLLIAFDFSPEPLTGNIRRLQGVPPEEAQAYRRANTAQADVHNRAAGFGKDPIIALVTLIEVA